MDTKFKKIKQVSAVDQVSDSLRDMIASGELKVGDRLPSEADLAASYGVNRMTVRMALQKLSVLGLVETRVGEGSFITQTSVDSILREIPPSAFSQASMDEVLQFRRMLELESIKLAISRASDQELDGLYKLAGEADRPLFAQAADANEGLLLQQVDADYLFHRQLILCSHNQLFAQLFQLMEAPIRAYIFSIISMRVELAKKIDPSGSNNPNIHGELGAAIRERNWKACKSIYIRMTEYVYYEKV